MTNIKSSFSVMAALFSIAAVGSPAQAQSSVGFFTIQTNTMDSEYELASECSADADQAAKRLTEISTRLTGNANSLSVQGNYGWTSNSPIFPTQPDPTNTYYCVLNFSSADPSVHFDATSVVSYIHLSHANWDTACKAGYDSANANPNSPMTVYWKSWTLFQGFMCEVTTIDAIKN